MMMDSVDAATQQKTLENLQGIVAQVKKLSANESEAEVQVVGEADDCAEFVLGRSRVRSRRWRMTNLCRRG